MNCVIIAVVLAVFQAAPPLPGNTPDGSARASSHVKSDSGPKPQPTAQSLPTDRPNESPAAKRDTGQQQGNSNTEHSVGISKLPPVSVTRDWADWGYWAFGGLLVIVGFFQVWLLRSQADLMREQAEISSGTLSAIERQANLMAGQLTEMEKSRDVQTKTLILQYRPKVIVRARKRIRF